MGNACVHNFDQKTFCANDLLEDLDIHVDCSETSKWVLQD